MPVASFANLLIRRLGTHWRLKLGLTVLLNLLFWGGYQFFSRHALTPIRTLQITWLDRWAEFQPQPWTVIYETVYILVGLIPWLSVTREEIRRYVVGFAALSVISFAVFAVFPVASPRPDDLGPNPFLVLVTQLDGPLNAFPSLHAGSVVYTIALAWRLFGRLMHPLAMALLPLWGLLILYGTLATKQHYAVDLLAGGLIGWWADRWAWRHASSSPSATDKTRLNAEASSQNG
ncbi:MAG TPA: phosphatase PAP2 family protein [Candidatus Limnocylindria bacterium]|jgi:membrane-associated phospholipid phosphatase|nr:phosphatase PAP2 family protein [Candidatus Limnocylindria bacterium]